MIKNIRIRVLWNAEYLQFLKLIIKAVNDNNPAVLKIEAQLAELKNQYEESELLFKLPQNSEITAEITALDTKRDNVLRGISLIINANLNHWKKEYVDAAERLRANLKLYGSEIYNLNYQAESATINSLLTDWDTKPELTGAINLLGLDTWKIELAKDNELFFEAYSERSKELGQKNTDNLKSRRELGLAAYDNLVKFLHAYETLDPAAYVGVVKEMNAIIDQYNTLLKARQTYNKSKGKAEDDTEDGEDPTV